MSKSDASGLANTIVSEFCKAFRITNTRGKDEAVLTLIEALEHYGQEQASAAYNHAEVWMHKVEDIRDNVDALEAKLAILREALERIAKETEKWSLDEFRAVDRPTVAATIAREALLRAGMGEKREHPIPMPSYEDEHGIKRHAAPLTAPQPEARSCGTCKYDSATEDEIADDETHPCWGCDEVSASHWTPEAGEGEK